MNLVILCRTDGVLPLPGPQYMRSSLQDECKVMKLREKRVMIESELEEKFFRKRKVFASGESNVTIMDQQQVIRAIAFHGNR